MSSQSMILRAERLRSLAFSELTTGYLAMGTPFSNAVRILHLQNLTNANVLYSFDGLLPDGILAANGGFILLDATANKINDNGLFIKVGTHMHFALVSGDVAPTSGNVYMSVFYAARD